MRCKMNKYVKKFLCLISIHGPQSPLYRDEKKQGVYAKCRWCGKPLLVRKTKNEKTFSG
jgi:hypothetical protein